VHQEIRPEHYRLQSAVDGAAHCGHAVWPAGPQCAQAPVAVGHWDAALRAQV